MVVRADNVYASKEDDGADGVRRGTRWRVTGRNETVSRKGEKEWFLERIEFDGTETGEVISRRARDLENPGLWIDFN
jgi:hypothetical protein